MLSSVARTLKPVFLERLANFNLRNVVLNFFRKCFHQKFTLPLCDTGVTLVSDEISDTVVNSHRDFIVHVRSSYIRCIFDRFSKCPCELQTNLMKSILDRLSNFIPLS